MNRQLFKYTEMIGQNGNDTLLFCFHYGGGGAAIYQRWPKYLQHDADMVAVQLPGREDRLGETFYIDIAEITNDIKRDFDDFSYKSVVFFGYCMGGLIAYELAQQFKNINLKSLLIAASAEPEYAAQYNLNRVSTDNELRKAFSAIFEKQYGIPCEAEYLDMMLPILKADNHLTFQYKHTHKTPLKYPMHVFGGTEDIGIPIATLNAWKHLTCAAFDLQWFPGDHMFIDACEDELLSAVKNILENLHGT